MTEYKKKGKFKKMLDIEYIFLSYKLPAPGHIAVNISTGKIVYVNEKAARLFGYKIEELCDKSLYILLPDYVRNSIDEKTLVTLIGFAAMLKNLPIMARPKLREGITQDGVTITLVVSSFFRRVEKQDLFLTFLDVAKMSIEENENKAEEIQLEEKKAPRLINYSASDAESKLDLAERAIELVAGKPRRTLRLLGLTLLATPIAILLGICYQIVMFLATDPNHELTRTIFRLPTPTRIEQLQKQIPSR